MHNYVQQSGVPATVGDVTALVTSVGATISTFLGVIEPLIGTTASLVSIAWVIYQWNKSRKSKD